MIYIRLTTGFSASPETTAAKSKPNTNEIQSRGGVYNCNKNGKQGNVNAILDSTGTVVVEYTYDAWGNHKVLDASGNVITSASHIGNVNPFRYRGYFYRSV